MAGSILSADQLQRLIDSQLSLPDVGAHALDRLAADAGDILGCPVAIFARRGRAWSIEAGWPVPLDVSDALSVDGRADERVDDGVGGAHDTRESRCAWTTLRVDSSGAPWTFIGVTRPARLLVAVGGDWLLSSPRLTLWVRALAGTRRAGARAAAAALRTVAHRLSVRLSTASSTQEVCDVLVRRVADAVNARLVAIAVPAAPDHELSVVATFGYPLDLVKHLRIQPGEGVIGSVFASGRMLFGKRAGDIPGRKKRPRYRTESFVAIPVRAGANVVAVLCVTDRADGGPFTRRDASALRALAAPAALALERERARADMRELAHGAAVDPVSGSFNRRHFEARLEEELQRSRRDHLTLALLMLDIDDFKLVNDSFGHPVGDMVIRDVAEILRRSVRVFDVCARFGGEEFAVLMPASTIESAAKVADRVRERIETYRRAEPALEALRVTVSVGLAVSEAGTLAGDLIAKADDALYRAKREGKNRLRIFPSESTQEQDAP